MDTAKINTINTVNTVEWFFGYGGNHLGLRRIIPNLQLVAACEIESYAVANMVAKMEKGLLDPAPIWNDCKTFPSRQFHGLVDLFIASYPCQGFSCAGKREGVRDPRFLWPWVYRFVIEARPRVVFFENVEGHLTLGLSTVLSDLEEAGYRCARGIFSAAECGAAHRRKRVFILGYDMANAPGVGFGQPGQDGQSRFKNSSQDGLDIVRAGQNVADATGIGEREPHDEECAEPRDDARENSGGRSDALGDAVVAGLEGRPCQSGDNGAEQPPTERTSLFWPSAPARPGEPQHAWEPPRVATFERGVGRSIDGCAARLDASVNTDQLRLLGNGVYPACAAKAFVTLSTKLASGES